MNAKYLRPEALRKMLDDHGWAGFAAFIPEHVFLLTGFLMPLHRNTNPRTPVTVVASKAGMVLVAPRIQLGHLAQYAEGELTASSVVTFGDFDLEHPERAPADLAVGLDRWTAREERAQSWQDAVARALQLLGITAGPIGCDQPPAGLRLGLGSDGGYLELMEAAAAFAEAVRFKNHLAVQGLRNAARIAEEATTEMLASAVVGVSEAELHLAYRRSVAGRGATAGHVGIGVGAGSVLPINRPNTRRLGPGDLIKIDVGALCDGFFADIACMVSVGRPAPRATEVMTALIEGQRAALGWLTPGNRSGDAFDAAVRRVRTSLPNYRRPHCGHGIGVQRYEKPMVAPAPDEPFVAGEVVNVEVPYYEFGFGGFNVEDTVVIEEQGPRLLTSLPSELLPIGEFLERAGTAELRSFR